MTQEKSEPLQDFLKNSPLARSTTLRTRVVLARQEMTLERMEAAYPEGRSLEVEAAHRDCVLEVEGVEAARGRLVRKGGEIYFQVQEEL